MSHAAPHPILQANFVPDRDHLGGPECLTCGKSIVWVETKAGSRNRPHWRHKPLAASPVPLDAVDAVLALDSDWCDVHQTATVHRADVLAILQGEYAQSEEAEK